MQGSECSYFLRLGFFNCLELGVNELGEYYLRRKAFMSAAVCRGGNRILKWMCAMPGGAALCPGEACEEVPITVCGWTPAVMGHREGRGSVLRRRLMRALLWSKVLPRRKALSPGSGRAVSANARRARLCAILRGLRPAARPAARPPSHNKPRHCVACWFFDIDEARR